MSYLKARRVVQGAELLRHRLLDLGPVVPRPAGPEPRERVEQPPAAVIDVVAPLRPGDHPRVGVEVAVGAEGHPVVVVEPHRGVAEVALALPLPGTELEHDDVSSIERIRGWCQAGM